jgi:hypothetical protein
LLLKSLEDNDLTIAHPPVFAFFTWSPVYYGFWLEAKKLAKELTVKHSPDFAPHPPLLPTASQF